MDKYINYIEEKKNEIISYAKLWYNSPFLNNEDYPFLKTSNLDLFDYYSKNERKLISSYIFFEEKIINDLILEPIRYFLQKSDDILYIDKNSDEGLLETWIRFIIVKDNIYYCYRFADDNNFNSFSIERTKTLFQKHKVVMKTISFRKNIKNLEDAVSFKCFLEDNFMDIDAEKYISVIKTAVINVKGIVGLKCAPYFNGRYAHKFKDNVIRSILNSNDNFSGKRYIILDYNKINNIHNITQEDIDNVYKKYDFLDFIIKKQSYLLLYGNNDFAKSFFTSEFLYEQYGNNENIDFLNIAAGYIKSVEQLTYDIKNIFISKKNSSHDFCDGKSNTMKNFCTDINKNKDIIFADEFKNDLTTIIDCLYFFCDEIRNEYMHRNIISEKNVVDKIRNNTIAIFYILLGATNIKKDSFSKLGYVKNNFETLYECLMDKANCKTFLTLEFSNGTISAVMPPNDNKAISYGKDGKILNRILYLLEINANDEIKNIHDLKGKKKIEITPSYMPERVCKGGKIIWEKE